MTSSLTVLEGAIICRILGLGRDYLSDRNVCTYGGQFDDDLTETVRQFPAIWIAFSSKTPSRTLPGGRLLWDIEFIILAGATGPDEQSTRQGYITQAGETLDIGTYQLLDDICEAMAHRPVEQMKLVRPGQQTSLYNGRLNGSGVSIMATRWTLVDVDLDALQDRPDQDGKILERIDLRQNDDDALRIEGTMTLEF